MKIHRYSTEPEAQKIKFLLESQNIPCELHSFENWGYDGVFRGQMGMGEIVVPDRFADRAKEIINKFLEEERNKLYEEDVELKSIRLKRDVGKFKILIFYPYVIFIIISYFLLFRIKAMFTVIVVVLLFIGAMRVTFYAQKELKRVRKELESMKKISQNKISA